jgi:hypothetical protein
MLKTIWSVRFKCAFTQKWLDMQKIKNLFGSTIWHTLNSNNQQQKFEHHREGNQKSKSALQFCADNKVEDANDLKFLFKIWSRSNCTCEAEIKSVLSPATDKNWHFFDFCLEMNLENASLNKKQEKGINK